MLQTGELYRERGGDYHTRQNPDRTTKHLVRKLEALGQIVTPQTATSTTTETPEGAA